MRGRVEVSAASPETLPLVEDPSDWPIPDLASLDLALRCNVCKEFLSAPVMLYESDSLVDRRSRVRNSDRKRSGKTELKKTCLREVVQLWWATTKLTTCSF